MSNLYDHLRAVEALAPSEAAPSRGDLLLLSQLAYVDLPNAAATFGDALTAALSRAPSPHRFGIEHRRDRKLIERAAKSRRFRDIPYLGFREVFDADDARQFAAYALRWDENTLLALFRGTDSSFAGWKENFMLCYRSPVPAQKIAVEFLNDVAARHAGEIVCAGHSKGGNLAIYAAAFADAPVRRRVREVLSFDGPGLSDADFKSAEFAEIRGRACVYIPRASLVGLLFSQPPDVRYISAWPGPLSHYPYMWRIRGGDFVPARRPSRYNAYRARTLHRFIRTMGPENLEQFVEALFSVISSSDAASVPEMLRAWRKSVPRVLGAARGLDRGTRRLFSRGFRMLLGAAAGRVPDADPPTGGRDKG